MIFQAQNKPSFESSSNEVKNEPSLSSANLCFNSSSNELKNEPSLNFSSDEPISIGLSLQFKLELGLKT